MGAWPGHDIGGIVRPRKCAITAAWQRGQCSLQKLRKSPPAPICGSQVTVLRGLDIPNLPSVPALTPHNAVFCVQEAVTFA